MDIFLQGIKEKFGGNLQIDESTWFNGHAYMPLSIYTLEYNLDNLNVHIKYEYRKSEFENSTVIDGGTFGDRHIFEVSTNNSQKIFPNFEIREVGFFKRMFFRSKRPFRILCKSEDFTNFLEKNISLNEIMGYVNIDSEFSPSISGKNNNGTYYLKILFLTKKQQYRLLTQTFAFISEFR